MITHSYQHTSTNINVLIILNFSIIRRLILTEWVFHSVK